LRTPRKPGQIHLNKNVAQAFLEKGQKKRKKRGFCAIRELTPSRMARKNGKGGKGKKTENRGQVRTQLGKVQERESTKEVKKIARKKEAKRRKTL